MALTPASMALGGVGNGLSPISSSMTFLPDAISCLATASTVNAVSTSTEEANRLNAGIGKESYQGGTSNVERRASIVERQSSNVNRRTSIVERQSSNINRRTSSV